MCSAEKSNFSCLTLSLKETLLGSLKVQPFFLVGTEKSMAPIITACFVIQSFHGEFNCQKTNSHLFNTPIKTVNILLWMFQQCQTFRGGVHFEYQTRYPTLWLWIMSAMGDQINQDGNYHWFVTLFGLPFKLSGKQHEHVL